MRFFISLILACFCCNAGFAQAASYAVARSAAPVLNTPAIGFVFGGVNGKTLKTDRCGQVRELEFIALPVTVFIIHSSQTAGKNTILRVATDEYPMPVDAALFVDSRFVDITEKKPLPRVRKLPSQAEIVTALKGAVGAPYVWGGNVQGGVAELTELFYGGDVPALAQRQLTLAGLDCSGLLYQATGGWTPRNTLQLLSFGKAVSIVGKTPEGIAALVEPLDLIVWNGHVLIVLDRETIIESRLNCDKKGVGGVVVTPRRQRLTEIMRTRRPLDVWPSAGKQRGGFVVRRWFDQ